MNIYMLIMSSLFLLFIAGNTFYVTFKKYREDDDFTFNTLTWIEVIFSVLLLISEKFVPNKYQIIIFKTFSFLFGIFFLGFTVLLWILFA
ncbi:hypothetical protein SporoP37_04850 [Sporosarcina sp. P37]|nr:hypothetical protein SporoP33_04040 [Sporosarcina sp. P33]ARK24075.1 hypothetical protein SporoP37_04850 [Sporosarcina sp. P37]PID18532.1 hypothetical protein CSV62_07730 [Sporosarcina sp. P35]